MNDDISPLYRDWYEHHREIVARDRRLMEDAGLLSVEEERRLEDELATIYDRYRALTDRICKAPDRSPEALKIRAKVALVRFRGYYSDDEVDAATAGVLAVLDDVAAGDVAQRR